MAISPVTPVTPPLRRGLTPPEETPPAEGSTSEAHVERADGGIWEHPVFWAALVLLGSLVVAGYFVARVFEFA
ncbi:DUF6480 family protein [Streptomyces sp. NRRL WC-3549]|uniref:DUF6480 family protein n=1 Tax=Streptomyces sp. NRRL WC-3549 TaxID=1463925 RepID=UPI0005680DCF|nr:DUF6480 family protein [Streptomyces sp. NRRL WC-3549]